MGSKSRTKGKSAELEVVHILIPGQPHAQGRARACRAGKSVRVYDPEESRNWKATAQQYMADELDRHDRPWGFECAMSVDILAVFPCPMSDYRKRKPRERRWHMKARGDADNIAKAVLDAGNGVLWKDDCQVALLNVVKLIGGQGELPYVDVIVTGLGAR